MKNTHFYFLIIILLANSELYGQDTTNPIISGIQSNDEKVPEIDPRRFLVIKEIRFRNASPDTVWYAFNYFQNSIDSRSEILIEFDKDSLKKQYFFEGNISLIADINGNKIELPPYSEVGEGFSTVGTESLSPFEYSLSFVSAMNEVNGIVESSNEFKKIDNGFASQDNMRLI